MKRHFINTVTATSALGLLLALPGLANAEDYYVRTKGYRVEPDIRSPRLCTEFEQNPIRAVSRY